VIQAAPATLTLRLLGPFDARLGGEPLPRLRSRKGEWLLSLLVLHHGRSLDRSWLAALLWPDSETEQGLAYLRQSLTNLRAALGPEGCRLVSPGHRTLALDLVGTEVDLLEFDRAVADGTAASLRRAVELHGGPLLEGCAEEWIAGERQARQEAFLGALERLSALALEEGDYPAAQAMARRAIAAEPLRESAHRHLLRALAAAGDFAAVLAAYRELRDYLHRELHSAPSAETAALYEELRARERQRATPPAAPPPPALREVIRRLPRPLTELIGREREAEEVRRLLRSSRLVTLLGSGGVGKTRLAIRVAEELAAEVRDGAWFVDLAPVLDPTRAAAAIVAALEIAEDPDRPPLDLLRDWLAPRELLLVLDNCEQVAEACAELAQALLARCPGLKILATSRQRLHAAGESAWRVPSLSLPREGERLEAMRGHEAFQLFVIRARTGIPGLEWTEAAAEAVAQICRRLDGIPLAIELAAARVRVLSPQQIAARLDDSLRLLAGGSPSALPRQRTLRAAIDWSHDLLPGRERAAFRKLAVFVGGGTLEAAARIWDVDEWEALDLLTELLDRSLLTPEETADGERRYRMLETIREYALERLRGTAEEPGIRRLHAGWFLEQAEGCEAVVGTGEHGPRMRRVQRDADNLRAALRYYDEQGEDEPFLRLAVAMTRPWVMAGMVREAGFWLGRALERGDAAPPVLRAKALNGAGTVTWHLGDFAAARRRYEESLAIYRRLGDERGVVTALNNVGMAASRLGDLAAARRCYEEGLASARKQGDLSGILHPLNNCASLARCSGESEAAWDLYREALEIARTVGDRLSEAISLNGLALISRHRGDYPTAIRYLEESAAIDAEIGYRRGYVSYICNLALLYRDLGRYAEAREKALEGLQIGRELEDVELQTAGLNILGQIVRRLGALDEAEACQREALGLALRSEELEGIATALAGIASVVGRRGEPERAARLYGYADHLRRGLGYRMPPPELRYDEEEMAPIREAVGDDRFAELQAEGAGLTREDALRLAR
jgi:predicted ATPase/DNA-binding SARP family transcriptional activator